MVQRVDSLPFDRIYRNTYTCELQIAYSKIAIVSPLFGAARSRFDNFIYAIIPMGFLSAVGDGY